MMPPLRLPRPSPLPESSRRRRRSRRMSCSSGESRPTDCGEGGLKGVRHAERGPRRRRRRKRRECGRPRREGILMGTAGRGRTLGCQPRCRRSPFGRLAAGAGAGKKVRQRLAKGETRGKSCAHPGFSNLRGSSRNKCPCPGYDSGKYKMS